MTPHSSGLGRFLLRSVFATLFPLLILGTIHAKLESTRFIDYGKLYSGDRIVEHLCWSIAFYAALVLFSIANLVFGISGLNSARRGLERNASTRLVVWGSFAMILVGLFALPSQVAWKLIIEKDQRDRTSEGNKA